MKTKILIIYAKGSSELLNRQSALGSYILCLGKLLNETGHDIYINGESLSQLGSKPVSNLNVPVSANKFSKFIPGSVKNIFRDKKIFAKHKSIFKDLKNSGPYTLILEFYTYGSNLGTLAGRAFNCPLITIFDSPVLEEYVFFNGAKLFNRRKIESEQNATLKNSNLIVVYSNAVKDYVEQRTNIIGKTRIHQNVDFTRFDFIEPRKIESEINIGFIGSFLKWHRVDLLLNIFEKLKNDGLNVKLWLVGSGMHWPVIAEKVSNSPYKDSIHLTGFCDGAKLLEIKKHLHIGVMPGSNWYGAPNKIFEYGAAGLAVMAPSTPTIKDLFTNEIRLFDWDNETSAYEELKYICLNPHIITLLQTSLQQFIQKKYSAKNTLNFYNGLIAEVLVNKRSVG